MKPMLLTIKNLFVQFFNISTDICVVTPHDADYNF